MISDNLSMKIAHQSNNYIEKNSYTNEKRINQMLLNQYLYMKLFDISSPQFSTINKGTLTLTCQCSSLIVSICKNLRLNLQACHYALWFFHCNATIMSFHRFDRFVYICAVLLIGIKLGQCLFSNALGIIRQCRSQLRKIKGDTNQDSEQTLQKFKKKVIQAELVIMINVGFDFDIRLALDELSLIKKQIQDDHLIGKVTQTLTSFYKTQVVIFYSPSALVLTALEMVMKNQGINISLSGISNQLVQKLTDPVINQVKKTYFDRSNLL